jgi:hypothetical protein
MLEKSKWEELTRADPHTKYCNARKLYFSDITSTNVKFTISNGTLGLKNGEISMARKTMFFQLIHSGARKNLSCFW